MIAGTWRQSVYIMDTQTVLPNIILEAQVCVDVNWVGRPIEYSQIIQECITNTSVSVYFSLRSVSKHFFYSFRIK